MTEKSLMTDLMYVQLYFTVHIPKIVSVLEHAMFAGNVRPPVVEHECVNVVSR